MSTVKSKKLQVGTDATSSNNFTIYQPATPDGTLRIGVGNADSPTEVARFDSIPSYSARAWVNFNGTGTVAIRASGNVSSITDNGTGDYTVNFATAMPDANYSAVMGWRVFSSANIRAGGFNNYTTSSVDVYGGYRGGSSAFTAEDATFVSVAIFR